MSLDFWCVFHQNWKVVSTREEPDNWRLCLLFYFWGEGGHISIFDAILILKIQNQFVQFKQIETEIGFWENCERIRKWDIFRAEDQMQMAWEIKILTLFQIVFKKCELYYYSVTLRSMSVIFVPEGKVEFATQLPNLVFLDLLGVLLHKHFHQRKIIIKRHFHRPVT